MYLHEPEGSTDRIGLEYWVRTAAHSMPAQRCHMYVAPVDGRGHAAVDSLEHWEIL